MNEETALVLTDEEQRELAAYIENDPTILDPAGLENVADEDLARPPYMKVSSQNKPVENESGEEIPPGNLVVMPDAVLHARSFDVVLLATTPVTFADQPPYQEGGDPYCLSDPTGMFPIPQGTGRIVTDPRPGPCRSCDGKGIPRIVCPRAQWGELNEETGKNEKPGCQKQLGFVLWLIGVEDNDGVAFRTHRTANKFCGKQLNLLAKKCGLRYRLTLTTKKVEDVGTGNKWWVPIVSKGARLTQREMLQAIRLKKEWEGFMPAADYDHDEFDSGYTPDADADIVEGSAKPVPEDEIPF